VVAAAAADRRYAIALCRAFLGGITEGLWDKIKGLSKLFLQGRKARQAREGNDDESEEIVMPVIGRF
jgi:hypothetical protein